MMQKHRIYLMRYFRIRGVGIETERVLSLFVKNSGLWNKSNHANMVGSASTHALDGEATEATNTGS